MKNIVISDEYKAVDLKPSDLLRTYITLAERDVQRMSADRSLLRECDCPACHSPEKQKTFEKFGLKYQECRRCHTLYISPRPEDKTLNEYYLKSQARVFWREKLAKASDKKRKEKIIKPRFAWVLESTREYLPQARVWADVNTSQAGYVDAMADADLFTQKIMLNPYVPLEPGGAERITVVAQPWWETSYDQEIDVMSLFEVADHTADISALFYAVNRMLRPGGLCFLTTILASGFDLQVLWDKAENLYPPDRLNCFTVEGLKALFARHGFECIEFSTPGILDVEIVAKAAAQNPQLEVPRFVKSLLDNPDDEVRRNFQEYLQSARLSSYGRILLRKK